MRHFIPKLVNDKVPSDNKVLKILQLLMGLYSEYLNLETEFDSTDYEDASNFDYDKIRSI